MTVVPKAVLIFLSSIAGAFFIIYTLMIGVQIDHQSLQTDDILALWNVDNEVSIPTWFSQSLLLAAAALLFVIAKTTRHDKRYWYVLAGMVLFVSIDEGASIHELLTVPMRDLLAVSAGPLYYAWVIVYGAILLVVGLFFVRFFLRLDRRTMLLLAMSLVLFLGGAIGMEMVGAWLVSGADTAWQLYALVVGIEELLEMLGASLLIFTLLDYMARHLRILTLRFADSSGKD